MIEPIATDRQIGGMERQQAATGGARWRWWPDCSLI
jgi:hypothetical protein